MKPNAFLFVFRGIERVYGIFVTHDHVTSGWQGLKTIRAIVGDIAPFMAAAAFIPVLIFAEVEIIMILYNIVKEQIEARHKRREERQRERLAKARTEARAEGLAEGRSEGLAEGLAEGRSEGLAEGLAEGRSEGLAEGRSEGRSEGFQEANEEWIEWFKRKDAAETAGEPFDEPSPAEKHENGRG